MHALCNKVYQRLYLPPEVSPEYTLIDLSLDRNAEIARVVKYFNEKDIDKVVLKHPDTFMGMGNVFMDSIQNQNTIRQEINNLSNIRCACTQEYPNYILVEDQKTFPRISRKTGKEKTGFTTYRIVAIADENGIVGYFIATKSISNDIDSHKRTIIKAYFDGDEEISSSSIVYCGLKDKYYNIGENRIKINPESLEKISKAVYKLYQDLLNMDNQNFKCHVDSLALNKKEPRESPKNQAQLMSKSFLSALKMIATDDLVKAKTSFKEGNLSLRIWTPQPRLPSEVLLFFRKIASKCANSSICSLRSKFFSAFQCAEVIKVNVNDNFDAFMRISEETKIEFSKEQENLIQLEDNQKVRRSYT